MNAIEFTADLSAEPVLRVPREIAARLPKSGRARVIVLMPDADDGWYPLSALQLSRAYGENEPEYGAADLRP